MEKIIKISLAVLLLLCIFDMPYGFYQFVRFSALVGFGTLAYQANEKDNQTELIIFGVLALMFQPFLKISFGRDLWNVIDVIVAIGLILSLFKKKH